MVKRGEFIKEHKDGAGYFWSLLDQAKKTDEIEVFWSGERLVVRQENDGEVDIVSLSVPQVYDMLAVFSRALNVGPSNE